MKKLNTDEIVSIIGLFSFILIPIILILWIWIPNPTNIDLFYIKLIGTDLIIVIVMTIITKLNGDI